MRIPRIALIVITLFAVACQSRKTTSLFELVPAAQSQVTFGNRITENDTINPFDMTNMYNGAGVGIGDFNGDGLYDIYFAGNQVASQLYLNLGGFQFRDITAIARVDAA